jgi:putative serine protease PepD
LSTPTKSLRLVAAGLVGAAALAACGGDGDEENVNSASAVGTSQASSQSSGQTAAAALALQNQIVRVVKTVSPAVVQIQTNDGSLGSGVVYDANGNVVTNAHVVGDAKTFVVTLSNGRRHSATLVGSFRAGDLAVVRLKDERPKPATFADSSKVRVGDFALAIGNPLGLRSSVTDGIVSSLGRTVPEGGGVAIPSAIQTSAAINPGNSGGALVNITGQVIGIPTLAAIDPSLGDKAAGIGFAIPSNTVKNIADQLIEHGRVIHSDRAYLGVRISTIVGGGVLVAGVEPGGPAAGAGIRPGDVIVSVNEQPTPTTDVLASVLATLEPGKEVPVEVVHENGRSETVEIKLGQLPGG